MPLRARGHGDADESPVGVNHMIHMTLVTWTPYKWVVGTSDGHIWRCMVRRCGGWHLA